MLHTGRARARLKITLSSRTSRLIKTVVDKNQPVPYSPNSHIHRMEHCMKKLIILRITLIAALALITPLIASCGSKSKLEGTYLQGDGGGTVTLDLKSAGKAQFTMMGDNVACTYQVNGDKLMLDCTPKGEKVEFTIHDDGSLTGPGFIGILKKSK